MEKMKKKKLVLENGDVYVGRGFGADVDAIGEIVFNTSMAGYQEIISDPSYADQIIVMSYPIIGNYGITDEDYESKGLMLRALIVRDCRSCSKRTACRECRVSTPENWCARYATRALWWRVSPTRTPRQKRLWRG